MSQKGEAAEPKVGGEAAVPKVGGEVEVAIVDVAKQDRTHWSGTDTKLLLSLMGDAKEAGGKFDWDTISYNISKKGSPMSGEQCSNKWRSLQRTFKV